jgi:Phage protein (N4 Gp49/phage Sf6 gene 66) family
VNRADGGANIVMKHTDIRGPSMETDKERADRTGLSSVAMTDDESAKVQKSPHRVTLDSMLMRIEKEEFIHPEAIPHMTICVLLIDNGFAFVGKSAPADPGNFNEELGRKFAKEDAIRQMWGYEGYLLAEKLSP